MKVFGRVKKLWKGLPLQTKKKLSLVGISLFVLNILVLTAGILLSGSHPVFVGLLALAYGLGLRHAVDADHIAAIDNTTRKFIQDGRKLYTIGFSFSLGHATIVIFLSLLTSFASNFIKHALPFFSSIGFFIGTTVSSLFLVLIGIINLIAFFEILHAFKQAVRKKKMLHSHKVPSMMGPLTKLFRPLMNTVNLSWHMYFIGFLFGLGFDTASEIALLSISAVNAMSGFSLAIVLLLPLAFTAGMTVVDTFDGILMVGAYGWAFINPARKLYYNLTITFLSVVIAFFIGGIQVIHVFSTQFNVHNSFFAFFDSIDLGNMGYIIVSAFLLFWIISICFYKMKKYDILF